MNEFSFVITTTIYLSLSKKKGALMCLKRKKTYEAQLDKLSGARMNIESQMMALENAQVTGEVVKAMKTGASTMKTLNQGM
jgi:charged multivesicular body protein 4